MSTRYNHKDYGTTELRNYGATQVRNHANAEVWNHVDGSEMTRRWLEDGSKKQASTPTPVLLNEFGKSMAWVWLECVLAVLMMVVGVSEIWAQTDYSGTYYIASNGYNAANTTTNYYLCPTDKWYYYQSSSPFYLQHTDSPDNNNGMPFMTTYQCRNGS